MTEKKYCLFILLRHFCALFHKCKYWFTDGWQIKGKHGGSYMLWRSFCLHGLGPLVPRRKNYSESMQSNEMLFYPDGNVLFQDAPTLFYSSQGFTQQFDEDENDESICYGHHSHQILYDHLWSIAISTVRKTLPECNHLHIGRVIFIPLVQL